MKKVYYFLAFLFASHTMILAQDHSHSEKGECLTQVIMNQMLDEDPALREQFERSEEITAGILAKNPNKSAISYTVPVVVHVVHEYGPENIPDSHIHAMIDEINLDFQKLNADTASVVSSFINIVGDMDMQFRLATKDPNGNCTNGITRVYDPAFTNHGGCPNGNCGTIHPNAWPKEKYLNVWVVKDIGSGAGAYAYLAQSNVPTGLDGIVCRYTQFSPLSQNPNSRTMTHEIGHYLNLYHTWGPTNNVGLPSNCNTDDLVGDTPNTTGTSGGCNLTRVTCSTLDNIQNHMDYANCPVMFTVGQVQRMQAAITAGFSQRNVLVSPANLIATGTDDATYANIPMCAPIAEFTPNSNSTTCQGNVVSFRERSYNGAKDASWTYQWSFPGGTPSSSTLSEPTVTYNTIGNFDVSLTVTNSAGSSQPLIRSNLISVLPGAGTFNAPYVEKISDPSWPNSSDPTLVWKVTKPQGSLFQFQRSTNAYYSPPSSIYLNNFSYNGTNEHILETPPMNLSALQSGAAFLNFQVAYSRKQSENEILYLDVSEDCGQTFKLEKFWIANNYVSVPNSNPTAFVPADTSEWRFMSYDISKFAGQNGTIFRFRFDASNGNNLFFDDIAVSNVSQPEPLTGFSEDLSASFNLYPNPNKGRFNLEFYYDGKHSVTAQIVDVIGKVQELNLNAQITEGWNIIEIDTRQIGLESGIYMLKMQSGKSSFTKRVIVE